MERIDNLIQSVGRLEGSVSQGFQAVHQRLEYQERSSSEWRHHFLVMLRHVDRKSAAGAIGRWTVPYAKIAVVIGLVILGTLGHISPEALKAAIAKILLSQVGGS